MQKEPDMLVQESLFTDQVKKCKHFAQAFALYDTKCTHDGLEKSYDTLRQYVDAHIEQRKAQKITDEATRDHRGAAANSSTLGRNAKAANLGTRPKKSSNVTV